MFLLSIKLNRVSFETKGRQNLQKTADFLIECIVFCPLVPPSWISLVDPTSAMYASAIYVSYIYVRDAQPCRHDEDGQLGTGAHVECDDHVWSNWTIR